MHRNAFLALGAALLVVAAASAEDSPQFGERFTRNQVYREVNLPDRVDPASGLGVKWKAKLGDETYGSPVIAQGRVFIGTNNECPRDPRHEGDRGILFCLDEKTGDFRWQLVVPKIGGDPYLDWPRAGICSPPTVEGDRVYALTNRAEVVCLDIHGMANGNDGPYRDEARLQTPREQAVVPSGPGDADVLWLTDLEKEIGMYHHDAAYGNPLIHGDFLYINSNNSVDNTHRVIRRPDAPSLVVLDKRTGRVVAKDNERIGPRIFHNTYSTPSLGTVGGRTLVCFGGGDGIVYAFEALGAMPPQGKVVDLKRVWKFDPDPDAPKQDVHKWIGNRKTSPVTMMTPPVFVDGRVYVTVSGDLWWGKYQAWVKCIDASRESDVTAGAAIWSFAMKHSCSAPAVAGPLTFVADTGNKTIHCLETATGKEVWTHPIKSQVWSSPLVADGKVYLGTRRGDLFVFAAACEKRLLCEASFGNPISAPLAVANGVLYLATHEYLYALGRANR